jgi:hypothetical protein
MAIDFQPTLHEDLFVLAADLLPADALEISATGFTPIEALENSWLSSLECLTARSDGKIFSVFGLSQNQDLGYLHPWMISTPDILIHRKAVLQTSKVIIQHWLAQHGHLINYVDARHTRAVRWLKWLGATLTPVPFGPYQRPFFQFTLGEN